MARGFAGTGRGYRCFVDQAYSSELIMWPAESTVQTSQERPES
jgi:hypothetical protein